MIKKHLYSLVFLASLSLLLPAIARAQEANAPQSPVEAVIADVMRVGPEIKIIEPITRDALLVGGSITVESPAEGDLILAGGEVIVKADVAGDVRVLGGRVTLDSKIGGNVTVIGGDVMFGKNSNIAGNIFIAAGKTMIDGRVVGNIIARTGEGRDFRVSHTAQINGSVNYRARSENANLTQNSARGGVSFEQAKTPKSADRFFHFFSLLSLFGLLVVGLFFVSLAPKVLRRCLDASLQKPVRDLLWGAGALITTPLVILFLALTLIGLPLAVILLLGYILIIYLANIFAGLGLGLYLARLAKGKEFSERISLVLVMILGVVVLWSLGTIPFAGPVIRLLAVVWGLGMIVRLKWQVIKQLER